MDQVTQTTDYPTGASRWILVITVISCALIELIDATIVNVALPEISGSIGATQTEIAWLVTSYAIANAIVIPLSGMLSDFFGRKYYFTGSVIVFTFGSLMCGLSTSLWMLVFWRFVQGLAGGGLASIAQSIMIDAFPPEKINTANTIFGIGMIAGPITGPVLGGFIVQHLSWHWIFFVNVPIGAICAVLSWLFVTNLEGSKKPPKIDWWGIAFLATAVGSILYVMEEGGQLGWFSSDLIIILSVMAIIAFIAFVWRELTAKHPAVNLHLLKNYNLAMGCILTLLMGCILMSGMFIFPLFVRSVYGWPSMKTGLCMMYMGFFIPVGMILAKVLSDKGLKPKFSMLIGTTLTVLCMLLFSFSTPNSHESNFILYLAMEGIGMPFLILPIMELSFTGFQGQELAQATGMRNMMKKLGGAIGLPLITIYINHMSVQAGQGMVKYTSVYNQTFTEKLNSFKQLFISAGYATDDAMKAAYQMMSHIFHRQQVLLSYVHGYFMMGILILLICVPVILLLKSPKKDETTA